MESELLKIINTELSKITNYEYDEYTSEVKYPYAVGEYNERNYVYEDGSTAGEIILTCFNRGSRSDLINIKEQIKEVFADYRVSTESGTISISYRNKLFIRSGEAEIKKMEIYLDTKVWEGA